MPLNLSSQTTPAVIASLGAVNAADLKFWTEAELYFDAGEAAENLMHAGLATVTPLTTTTVSGQAEYTFAPTGQVMLVTYAGRVLSPTTPLEMDALWPTWRTDSGTPTRWVGGETGNTIRLYPTPDAASTLQVLANVRLGTPSAGSPTLALPEGLTPWATLSVLALARGREGRGAMPDVAVAAGALAAIFAQAVIAYYGEG